MAKGGAGSARLQIAFAQTDDAGGTQDAQDFIQQRRPVPGAQEAAAQAHVDEIKGFVVEGERLQGVHDAEGEASVSAPGGGLALRDVDDVGPDVNAYN